MAAAKMYFLAIAAPADINEQVLQWKHYMRDHFGCTVALRSPAHITLIPPFWMNEELEDALQKDVAAFAQTQHSLTIHLHNFDAFKPKVIFVKIDKNALLEQLKLSLEDFLVKKGRYPLKKETRPFHPHLTIANRDLRKKDFAPAFEHFITINYEKNFTTTELALFKHDGAQWQIHYKSSLHESL